MSSGAAVKRTEKNKSVPVGVFGRPQIDHDVPLGSCVHPGY